METLHGRGHYVFPQLRQSRFPHLDPSAPNDFLKRIGYDGELVAHGWRSVARTYGVDILKVREVVIERQMGHLPKGKVDKAYDRATYLDERKDFLVRWCNLLEANGLVI
jgi:integrase